MGDETTVEPQQIFPNEPVVSRQLLLVRRFWAGFHNLIIVGLIFTLLGVAIGVKVSKDFYVDKIAEVVATGAMLHKAKVYTITLKP